MKASEYDGVMTQTEKLGSSTVISLEDSENEGKVTLLYSIINTDKVTKSEKLSVSNSSATDDLSDLENVNRVTQTEKVSNSATVEDSRD